MTAPRRRTATYWYEIRSAGPDRRTVGVLKRTGPPGGPVAEETAFAGNLAWGPSDGLYESDDQLTPVSETTAAALVRRLQAAAKTAAGER